MFLCYVFMLCVYAMFLCYAFMLCFYAMFLCYVFMQCFYPFVFYVYVFILLLFISFFFHPPCLDQKGRRVNAQGPRILYVFPPLPASYILPPWRLRNPALFRWSPIFIIVFQYYCILIIDRDVFRAISYCYLFLVIAQPDNCVLNHVESRPFEATIGEESVRGGCKYYKVAEYWRDRTTEIKAC